MCHGHCAHTWMASPCSHTHATDNALNYSPVATYVHILLVEKKISIYCSINREKLTYENNILPLYQEKSICKVVLSQIIFKFNQTIEKSINTLCYLAKIIRFHIKCTFINNLSSVVDVDNLLYELIDLK